MPISKPDSFSKQARWLWLLYTGFIVYGTLIPFYRVEGINLNDVIAAKFSQVSWVPFFDRDGSRASIPDIVQNILFFIPFGFFGYFSFNRSTWLKAMMVVAAGMCLSFVVEALQLTTLNRITSLTDVATNTIGTLMGVVVATSVSITLQSVPGSWKDSLRENRYSFLFLIACVTVVLGSLQPFDFSLDLGTVGWKLNYIARQPIRFQTNFRDEAVVGFRFFLLGCISALFCGRYDKQSYPWLGIVVAITIGVAFECCQLIVTSRMPSAQDIVVAASAAIVGGLFSGISFRGVPRFIWASLAVLATGVSAGVQSLSPFRWAAQYRPFNWFPFLTYYERTSFVSLSNFIESGLIYLPLGILLQLIYPTRRLVIPLAAVTSGLLAFSLEASQGWIEGRYPDITDVIGAIAGGFVGSWILWQCNQPPTTKAGAP